MSPARLSTAMSSFTVPTIWFCGSSSTDVKQCLEIAGYWELSRQINKITDYAQIGLGTVGTRQEPRSRPSRGRRCAGAAGPGIGKARRRASPRASGAAMSAAPRSVHCRGGGHRGLHAMPLNGQLNGYDPHSRDMLAALKQAMRHAVLIMLALPAAGP
jgi:hypothetical protein